jgi:di/tricarboxylate transporter
MNGEIVIVLIFLVVAVVLFATERLPVDLVAMLVMSALILSGVITAAEGIAGFSNPATITIGAMFVLSAGLFKTGAVNFVGEWLARLGRRSFWLVLVALMLLVGVLSSFLNNTAVVAVLLPVVLGVARETNVGASRLLMPLSFASMFGGVCTLIGTSTNILVSAVAEQHGLPAFGMFEFTPFGIVIFAVGTIYMLTVGVRLIPDRRTSADPARSFRINDYLTDIQLLPDSVSVGWRLGDSPLVRELNVVVSEISRDGEHVALPPPDTILRAGDVLRVRASAEKIKRLERRVGVRLRSGLRERDTKAFVTDGDDAGETVLVEAVLAPHTTLRGKTIKELRFYDAFNAVVLAIRHSGKLLRGNLNNTKLHAGDALLLEIKRDHLNELKDNNSFVVVSEIDLPRFRPAKIVPAVVIVAGVVISAALGLLPIVASAVIGSVLLILFKCLTPEEAYAAIDWRIIFLLAGVLTLGVALEKTGAATLLSSFIVGAFGDWGPVVMLSVLYLLTSLLTEAMSNNATAALLAPVAIATAETLNVSPRPFLVAVAFAASASFMTPVGYQTNTLIYGTGQYKFSDFLRIGAPLNLIFWILATLLIPRFWSF